MQEHLNYKTSLLYLYWLMAGADGEKEFDKDDPEWQTMQAMRKHEKITAKDFDRFIMSDLGTKEEQLNKTLDIIRKCTHEEQVRALAWMNRVMLADGDIHSKEHELYKEVRDRLDITEDEVKEQAVKLPET